MPITKEDLIEYEKEISAAREKIEIEIAEVKADNAIKVEVYAAELNRQTLEQINLRQANTDGKLSVVKSFIINLSTEEETLN